MQLLRNTVLSGKAASEFDNSRPKTTLSTLVTVFAGLALIPSRRSTWPTYLSTAGHI